MRPESLLHAYSASRCVDCDHEPLANYLRSLVEDYSWVKRRIDTVQLLRRGRQERRVTLDISGHELRSRASDYGLPWKQRLPIPFAHLPKGLLLDVDLIGPEGKASMVLTSHQDSFASQLILASLAADVRGGAAAGDLLDDFYSIALDAPTSPSSKHALERIKGEGPTKHDLISSNAEYLRDNFAIMTEIDPKQSTFMLKFRIVEMMLTSRRGPLEALCLVAQYYAVDAPSIGTAQREHLRVIAPKGLFVEVASLVRLQDDGEGDVTSDEDGLDAPEASTTIDRYVRRLTPERAIAYTRSVPQDVYSLLVNLRPSPTGAFTAAMLWSWAILFGLSAGVVGEISGRLITSPTSNLQIAPFLAAVLTLTSLGATTVLRADENELSGSTMAPLRGLLIVNTLLAVSAALSIAFDGWAITRQIAWYLALFLSIVTTTVFTVAWVRSRASLRAVESTSGDSVPDQIG